LIEADFAEVVAAAIERAENIEAIVIIADGRGAGEDDVEDAGVVQCGAAVVERAEVAGRAVPAEDDEVGVLVQAVGVQVEGAAGVGVVVLCADAAELIPSAATTATIAANPMYFFNFNILSLRLCSIACSAI